MGDTRNAYRIFKGKLLDKRPLGRLRKILKDIFKKDLREAGCKIGRETCNCTIVRRKVVVMVTHTHTHTHTHVLCESLWVTNRPIFQIMHTSNIHL
jgi:hypothetical protein